ncbi:Alpha/beta hydrolase [Nitratireductor aquimarinus]
MAGPAIMNLVHKTDSQNTAGSDPDRGVRTDIGGYRLNSLHLGADNADLPPVVFIHGASASLLDPLYSFRTALEGRARLLFIDRPGHGKSDRGPESLILPDGQAEAIAALMTARGIEKAIMVGHSYGGAVAAAMALNHPGRLLGTVFLSPALYPWPGGIAWYYHAAGNPHLGSLFSRLIVPLAGRLSIGSAARGVFAPNPMPDDYLHATRAHEAIEPTAFRHNAREICALLAWTERTHARYRTIKTPSVIITGAIDDVVSPDIHSGALARDLPSAELLRVEGLGHKPDYHATDLVVAAIEKLAGQTRDLNTLKTEVEQRL